MTVFVLDNSVCMRWTFATENKTHQQYAEDVLKNLAIGEAVVPELWLLEVINILGRGEKTGEIEPDRAEKTIAALQKLSIRIDREPLSFLSILTLVRRYGLSSYDAAYLEVALRQKLPIATLDDKLKKAAVKAGCGLFTPTRPPAP